MFAQASRWLNLLVGNRDLKDSDVEVLPLDICEVNRHETLFKQIISTFGKVLTHQTFFTILVYHGTSN